MALKNIAVLRGGVGAEHDVSLKTGAEVIRTIAENLGGTFRPLDVFIDRKGVWHVRGIPAAPERILSSADAVWNALHGEYGEDGTVQRILERIGVPYTGSGPYAAAASMNKALAKNILEKHGVKTPYAKTLAVSENLHEDIRALFRSFPQPSIVKPLNAGSSVGVSVAKSFAEFEQGIRSAFSHAPQVLVEEYIKGKEATCGVVDGLRGEAHYALPPVEIVPPASARFFNYEAKYSGKSEERVPGNFTREEADELQRVAKLAHETLGLRHYSRSDFILSKRGMYFLESNSLPGTTNESLLPKALGAVGVAMPEFIDHVLRLAVKGK